MRFGYLSVVRMCCWFCALFCVMGIISTHSVYAHTEVPYFAPPVIGVVSGVVVTDDATGFYLKNPREIDRDVFEVDTVHYSDLAKQYIQNSDDEVFSATLFYKHNWFTSSIFNYVQVRDGDIFINAPGFGVLFTKDGMVKQEVLTDLFSRIFKETNLHFESQGCLNRIPFWKIRDDCDLKVDFILNDHSFTLSPGQSYNFKKGEVRSIHLVHARSYRGDDFGGTNITYVLDSADYYPPIEDQPSGTKNSFQKIWTWFMLLL